MSNFIKVANARELITSDFKETGITDELKMFEKENFKILTMFYNIKNDNPRYRNKNSRYYDLIYFELYKQYGRLGINTLATKFLGFGFNNQHVYAYYDDPVTKIKIV